MALLHLFLLQIWIVRGQADFRWLKLNSEGKQSSEKGWHFCLRAVASLHEKTESQSCGSPRPPSLCIRQNNKCQTALLFTPVPTSESHYWAIGIIAVHLKRGSERLSIPGPWSIVSRLDQERRGASTVPLWKYRIAITLQPAFCLSTESWQSNRKSVRIWCVRCWYYKWLVFTKWQTLEALFELVSFKIWITGLYFLAEYEWSTLNIDAVRVRTTNENQWSSGAVRSCLTHCVRSIWHFIPLPSPLSKIYLQAIWMRNCNSKCMKKRLGPEWHNHITSTIQQKTNRKS